MRFSQILVWLCVAAAGFAVGAIAALWASGLLPGADPLDFGDVEVDGWRADFAIGSEAADPYTRARVARHGLLALAKTEAVYFTRRTDSLGAQLREECAYRLSGNAMPAQWWSITLYDAESRLPMNDDAALSYDASRASNAGDNGGWSALISAQKPSPPGAGWISSRNAGEFDLNLRLYVPDQALLDDPADTLDPPEIERMSCTDDAA